VEQTGPPPSYDELAVLVMALKAKVEELEAENAELKRRLGRNSRKSSTPPSVEGLDKPPPRSMRGEGTAELAHGADKSILPHFGLPRTVRDRAAVCATGRPGAH
jgi:hypothetical protein